MSNLLTKMMSSVLQSSAKSLLTGGIKKGVKTLIKQQLQKSPQDIEKEIMGQLGYLTSHYKLDKDQNIVYKPSSVFMHEWLTHSPKIKDRVIRDEEDGEVFVDNVPLTNQVKVELIHLFIKDTNAQSSALSSHFDAALKLLEVSDYNAIKFKKHFTGWDNTHPSIIDTWLEKCYGANFSDDPVYCNLIFRRWIIGAANRIMNAGSTLDTCLVFQGKSGIGKTQHARKLLPTPFDNRTGEIYCDVRNTTRIQEALLKHSLATLDELSILDHPNTVETLKQLLSSQFIDVRLAYRRSPQRFKMRTALLGTTNKERFIADAGLSRRLLVIPLSDTVHLDFIFLEANRTALWREACFLALRGDTYILTPQEQQSVQEHNMQFMLPAN